VIRAQVFVIGNVVCRFEPDRRLHELARVAGLAPTLIHEAIWESGIDARADAGALTPGELEREVLAALDDRIDAATLRAAWSTAFPPDPGVTALVRRLERPSFAFTNNGPMLTACLAHELAGVDALFERVVCSWQIKRQKPDPVAFERLCAELQRPPEELLFVDDSPENVAGARSAGLAAVVFTSEHALVADLERHGVLG
jgi:HAD superfamily hydrolase (TIGR01509 family)